MPSDTPRSSRVHRGTARPGKPASGHAEAAGGPVPDRGLVPSVELVQMPHLDRAALTELGRAAAADADTMCDLDTDGRPTIGPSLPCVICGQDAVTRWRGHARHAWAGCARITNITGRHLPPVQQDSLGVSYEHGSPYDLERRAFGRAVRRQRPDATDEDLDAALGLWHEFTDGLRWARRERESGRWVQSYPGEVGVARWARMRARAGAGAGDDRGRPTTHPLAVALGRRGGRISGAERLAHDFPCVVPDLKIEPGMSITTFDINGQFLAASRCEMGLGDPDLIEFPAGQLLDKFAPIMQLLKCPGYVRLAAPLGAQLMRYTTVAPHQQIPFHKLRRGEWLPMPIVKYLWRDMRTEILASAVLVWRTYGRPLDAWGEPFRRLIQGCEGRADAPARYAVSAAKSVYQSFLGGMLRSERFGRLVYHPDWAHQLEATGWANAWRARDKARVIGQLGMRRDALWVVHRDDPATFVPRGLPVGTQLGKFRRERWGLVDARLCAAYATGRPALVNNAIIDIHRAREQASR